MRMYWKNHPAKFHRDPVWSDGALAFFEELQDEKRYGISSSSKKYIII